MDSRYRFLMSGTPWTQSMPSRDVNAVTRLAEASWWRDNGSNDSERSDTKLEAPSFPIEYKIFCSTFYAKSYINRFRND